MSTAGYPVAGSAGPVIPAGAIHYGFNPLGAIGASFRPTMGLPVKARSAGKMKKKKVTKVKRSAGGISKKRGKKRGGKPLIADVGKEIGVRPTDEYHKFIKSTADATKGVPVLGAITGLSSQIMPYHPVSLGLKHLFGLGKKKHKRGGFKYMPGAPNFMTDKNGKRHQIYY